MAYINDVFLAQSGKRAIHGFGMGAQHFFGTSIQNLSTDQVALLVGMLKGPSFYNPRRNPNNATKRRNLVLRVLNTSNKISDSSFETLKNKELGVELKWFGNDDPSGFTSNHKSWKYVGRQQLNNSDEILSSLFDLRLPLTFSIDDCMHLSKIIIECSSEFIKH